MNCRRIKKLIPLFVEGDLDAGTMNAVSLHLNHCQACSQMMSEYGDSQNWLRTFAPPEFDSAFFVDLKQSVMQEIERKPARPTLIQQLTGSWNWNPTWAMAILMVMLVGAYVFYIYSGKTKIDSPEQRTSQDKKEQQTEPEQKENQLQPKFDDHKKLYNFRRVNDQRRRTQPKRAKQPAEKLPAAIQQNSQPLDNLAINIFDKATETDPINLAGIVASPISFESTRIEFQTSDPNIRIIWFAPKLNISQSSKMDTE